MRKAAPKVATLQMMLSRKQLKDLHPTTLAVLCQKLADCHHDAATTAKGRQLTAEWILLQTPPMMSLQEEREKDAKRWDLHQRMVEFLDGRDQVEFYPKR